MSKKFIITESEKQYIKKLYKLTEQDESDGIVQGFLDLVKQKLKNQTPSSSSDTSSSDETGTTSSTEKTDYSDLSGSSGDDFIDVTKKVIKKFEGGYWNPVCAKYPGTKHPAKTGMYSRSGETMFGLDREAGNIENVSSDGKEFFALIDKEKEKLGEDTFCNTWKWNYIPPDPLKSQLLELAAKTMKHLYEKNVSAFFKGKTKDVVNSSRALMLHFSYATWNGPGFFQKFARSINKAVEEGQPIKSLIEIAKADRVKSIGGAWAKGTQNVNKAIDDEAAQEGIT